MSDVFSVLNTKISRLGFGCMRFPTTEDGKIDREKATAMLDHAHASGITYYDTAWGYHEEESQYFVGEALVARYPRDSFYLATKLPPWNLKKQGDVDTVFNEQLKRCQAEYFDYYLMHAMNEDNLKIMEDHDAYSYLKGKKEQGIIKNLGFSFHGSMKTFEKMLDDYEWDFVQLQVNYFDFNYPSSTAKAEYEMATSRGIPVVVMEPVRGGFLANPPENAKKIMMDFAPERTPASWALRWCLDQKNMPLILSGMSAMEHLADNIETFKNFEPLTLEEKQVIQGVTDVIFSVDTVPCTACRYCMDCPFGVDIPGMFMMYNNYQLFGKKEETQKQYTKFAEESKDFRFCMQCGECLPLCPQGIAIPDELARVSENLKQFAKE